MPSQKISEMEELSAVSDDTFAPVIDAIDDTKNFKIQSKKLAAGNNPDGFAYVASGEMLTDDGITHPTSGTLAADTLTAETTIESPQYNLTGGVTPGVAQVDGSGNIIPIDGITSPDAGKLVLTDAMKAKSFENSDGSFSANDLGDVSLASVTAVGSVVGATIQGDEVIVSTGTPSLLCAFNGGQSIVDAPGISQDGAGTLSVEEMVECARIDVGSGNCTISDGGIIACASIEPLGAFNGTGVFTTFVIVNGIIMNAS